MYGGQSSKGFLVDHHLLLSKQGNDAELEYSGKIFVERRTNVQRKNYMYIN